MGHVFGHADYSRDLAVAITSQGLFTDIKAPPTAVAMAIAQLALRQLGVATGALLLADLVVMLGVLGVQQDLPEELAHLQELFAVVAQGLAQMVIAEDHALAEDVLHIQVIGHGAHHIRPEAFALEQ
ncbi:hypothetical protein D9M71_186790 [compost metagenome]